MLKTKLILASLFLAGSVYAADPEPGVSLTVYSSADPAQFDPKQYLQMLTQNPYYAQQMPMPGYGVVRDVRKLKIGADASELRFTDVAAGIDPTTVSFRSFTDPAASVLEQNFEFDLVNSQKLLKRYVDKLVSVDVSVGEGKTETVIGTLLSADSGLIIKDQKSNEVRIINSYTGIHLADASNLITRPTLVWNIDSKKGGDQTVEVSYQTDGITWRADYSLILNAEDTNADVSSWVTLLNLSGASYPNASLKLVAGDVQRIQPQQNAYGGYKLAAREMDASGPAGFAEKSFFEYHLYTLGRKTTIEQNATKQIELFAPKPDVPVEKVFVYYGVPESRYWSYGGSPQNDRNFGTETNKKVDLYVRFKNSQQQGLGIPLPAGRVRVYKRDEADGNVEFVGEDTIQHTPKDEEVLIKLGSAFDIVGERKQTDFQEDVKGHWITESFEIKLRNHKTTPATVIVKENLYRWSTWQITTSSAKWEKQDSRTIHIPVDLKPDEEKTITYTVKYTW